MIRKKFVSLLKPAIKNCNFIQRLAYIITMKTKLIFLILGFALLLHYAVPTQAFTTETNDSHPFTLFFEDEIPAEPSDGKIEVDFIFRIPKKHYLYQDNLRVELDSDKLNFVLSKPQGVEKSDPFRGKTTQVYYNQVAVLLKVSLHKDYDTSFPLTGRIYYQGCSSTICFRTFKVPFSIPLQESVQDIPATDSTQSTGAQSKSTSFFNVFQTQDLNQLLQVGLFYAILITFLAGVLTSLTPCVLPVIPLTLAFIGVNDKLSPLKRVGHLLVFLWGMSTTYSILGVASAYFGQTLGFLFQSQAFLIFLIVFMTAMSLWMFGVFNFQIPPKLQSKIVSVKVHGTVKYFYAGLTIGFLAAPCVGPILGPLLGYISITKDIFTGFVLMMAYSLGMGVLFFILGFSSKTWISKLGDKSVWVKRLFGMLLLLTAVYYLVVLVAPGFSLQTTSDSFFRQDQKIAFDLAKSENKGVMIDFYADWCLPCHEWDQNVWNDSATQQAILQNFVPLKIDCTKESKACEQAIDQYGVVGWPTIIFLNPELTEYPKSRIVGQVLSKPDFIGWLRKTVNGE